MTTAPATEQQQLERCENCGHAPHGHAEHLTDPAALTDCPHCPCAAELREMSGEDQPAVDQAADRPAAPRFLTEAEEEAAYEALRGELGPYARRVGHLMLTDALTAALAALRIFTPAPEPEPDTCPAQFVDLEGGWHQCVEDRGHAPALGHTDGEWAWPDGYTYATPDPES